MGALVSSGQVHVRRLQNSVVVDISADILFPSGVARLASDAAPPLQHLADALRPFTNAVRVEGHTDDRPINTPEFHSNWELSAARAASVVHLFMDRGIEPDRLAVVGFGQYRPVAGNNTAAGRNANRRVAVVIVDSAEPRAARHSDRQRMRYWHDFCCFDIGSDARHRPPEIRRRRLI